MAAIGAVFLCVGISLKTDWTIEMPSYSLTPEAKELAVELDRLVRVIGIKRDFQFIANDNSLYVFNQSSEAIINFCLLSGEPITVAELRELVALGLLSEDWMGGATYSFRVLPALHDAVAASFIAPPASAAISVDTMNVTASKVNIFYDLTSDHDKLADALMDRLIPFLQQQDAFTGLELQGLREAIEDLRLAVDTITAEDASKRIWTYIERTSAVVGILAAVTLGLPIE